MDEAPPDDLVEVGELMVVRRRRVSDWLWPAVARHTQGYTGSGDTWLAKDGVRRGWVRELVVAPSGRVLGSEVVLGGSDAKRLRPGEHLAVLRSARVLSASGNEWPLGSWPDGAS